MSHPPAACVRPGDCVEFEHDGTRTRAAVARVEYSTPKPGQITWTCSDGSTFSVSAVLPVIFVTPTKEP